MELILRQLSENTFTIPLPSIDEMMAMLLNAWKDIKVDNTREFKSLFLTHALDGSEYHLLKFRKQLMPEKAPENVTALFLRKWCTEMLKGLNFRIVKVKSWL